MSIFGKMLQKIKMRKNEGGNIGVEKHLISPVSKNDNTIIINYGTPQKPGTPDYIYETVKPNGNEEILLMAPLEIIVEIDNVKCPNGEFAGCIVNFIKMNFPDADIDIDYNNTESLANFYTITPDKKTLNIKLNDNWKQYLSAGFLNDNDNIGTLSFEFDVEIEAKKPKHIILKSKDFNINKIKYNVIPVSVTFQDGHV